MNDIENLLPMFQQLCESEASHQLRKAVVAGDETFFGELLIMVLMDLSSGYLILEEISNDRSFDTWIAKAQPRLQALGIDVNHAVSDRAKALIKLAVTGFDCQSGADTFHAQYDVSKWLGAKLGRSKAQAEKQHQATLQELAKNPTTEDATLLEQAIQSKKVCAETKLALAAYHENLPGIADEIHPFSILDNTCNDSETVILGLEKRAQAFEKIAQTQSIVDPKQIMKNNATTKRLSHQCRVLVAVGCGDFNGSGD